MVSKSPGLIAREGRGGIVRRPATKLCLLHCSYLAALDTSTAGSEDNKVFVRMKDLGYLKIRQSKKALSCTVGCCR